MGFAMNRALHDISRRRVMRYLLEEIGSGSSETKLYASLLARALVRDYPDELRCFNVDLKAAGVSTWNKKKKSERVKVKKRRDDDGDVLAHRPRVRA